MVHIPHEVFRGDGVPIGPTAEGAETKTIKQLNKICKTSNNPSHNTLDYIAICTGGPKYHPVPNIILVTISTYTERHCSCDRNK